MTVEVVSAEPRRRPGNTAAVVETAVRPLSFKDKTSPPGRVQRLTGGFFGPPKSGKTTAATSGKNVLLVEFDPDGDVTETLKDRKDVDVYKPDNWQDVDSMVGSLLGADRETWDWWVLDDIGMWFEMEGGKEISTTLKANRRVQPVYQRTGAHINQVWRDLLTVRTVNIIFTTQIKNARSHDEEDEAAAVTVGPEGAEVSEYPTTLAVTPMVYKVLAPTVSFLGRTYRRPGSKETRYMVSFDDAGSSPAGSRIGLPTLIETINLQTILEQLRKDQT